MRVRWRLIVVACLLGVVGCGGRGTTSGSHDGAARDGAGADARDAGLDAGDGGGDAGACPAGPPWGQPCGSSGATCSFMTDPLPTTCQCDGSLWRCRNCPGGALDGVYDCSTFPAGCSIDSWEFNFTCNCLTPELKGICCASGMWTPPWDPCGHAVGDPCCPYETCTSDAGVCSCLDGRFRCQ